MSWLKNLTKDPFPVSHNALRFHIQENREALLPPVSVTSRCPPKFSQNSPRCAISWRNGFRQIHYNDLSPLCSKRICYVPVLCAVCENWHFLNCQHIAANGTSSYASVKQFFDVLIICWIFLFALAIWSWIERSLKVRSTAVTSTLDSLFSVINVKRLNSLKQCLTATRPTSHN